MTATPGADGFPTFHLSLNIRKHFAMNDTTRPLDKLLYTPAEAARALGVGRSTLYLLLANGDIPSVRIGASRRIPTTALDAYVAELTSRAVSPPGDRINGLRSFRPGGAAAPRERDGREHS